MCKQQVFSEMMCMQKAQNQNIFSKAVHFYSNLENNVYALAFFRLRRYAPVNRFSQVNLPKSISVFKWPIVNLSCDNTNNTMCYPGNIT